MKKANNCRQNERKICYIVGAGEPFLPFCKKSDDLIIAADGGYDRLCARGIVPDLCIGDFDSASSSMDADVCVPIERHPVQKDETDMALAALRGYEMGYRRFILLGGTGGREDHTFANYQLLLRMARMGASGILVGNSHLVRVIADGSSTLYGQVGDTLSVFAFGGCACGVTLEGTEYPLTEGVLETHFPLGVSNSFAAETVRITVRDGALLIFSPLYDLEKIELF